MIVSLEEIKEQLAVTADLGAIDDALLARKLAAAQQHVENVIGFAVADRFGGEDQDPVPPALAEAVSQLAAWWYMQREAAGEAAREIPHGVREICAEFREYSF